MSLEIWQSFRRMPVWVQIWVAIVLVPVNLAAVAFVAEPYGGWIALLAIGGMAPNLPIMLIERGFSRTMTWSHLLLWTPLVALVIWILVSQIGLAGSYRMYLIVLLVVDLISLGFDYVDARKWLRGARAVA